MWDLIQDFHRLSRHASSPAFGILCFCVCCCLTLAVVSESTLLLQPFSRLFCSSVTDSGAWGYGDVTFHPVETVEEFCCHTVETALQQGFVYLQMCSWIFYKVQNRNTKSDWRFSFI